MNIDFHYYITFFICRCSGFSCKESRIVSYANQYTDDNDKKYHIYLQGKEIYNNTISYTNRILPVNQEIQVLLPLHFLPGEMGKKVSIRKDGKKSPINVTPGSLHSHCLLERSFSTHNLYRIGIMLHVFQDTWAHQNFTGIWDDWNSVTGNPFIPNIGHAELGQIPDMFNQHWMDRRLKTVYSSINNNQRFMECVCSIYKVLNEYKKPQKQMPWRKIRKNILDTVMRTKPENEKERCEDIRHLYREVFQEDMPAYKKSEWLDDAVIKKGLRLFAGKTFGKSHWYQYQKELKSVKIEILSYFFQRTSCS